MKSDVPYIPPLLSSEHAEQAAVIDWARLMEGRYPILRWLYSVPNGAALAKKRRGGYSAQAVKLKAEGMNPGVADLCLPCARGGYHGAYLEMKWGKNKLTSDQLAFLLAMVAEGYFTAVCYDAGCAIAILEKYLEGEFCQDRDAPAQPLFCKTF